METISVIVPVYQVQSYLDACIESLLQQTHTCMQLVAVDDGSPDSCGSALDAYALEDDRVLVCHQPNGGLSVARNTGIEAAQGTWMAFIDSDDFAERTFLESLYCMALSDDCGIAQCGIDYFDEAPGSALACGGSRQICTAEELLCRPEEPHCSSVCNKLYRASLFADLRFPPGRIHEDAAVTYRLMYAAGRVAVTDARLYHYRYNRSGITKSRIRSNRLDLLPVYRERVEFYPSEGPFAVCRLQAANAWAASFGALASYRKASYEDPRAFRAALLERYRIDRPALLRLPLRWDLYILVRLSRRSLFWLRLAQILKQRGFRA